MEKSPVTDYRPLFFTLFWIACAFLFDAGIWFYFKQTANLTIANQKALEFITAYLVEKSLSIDNMFVFLMIFTYFSVPVSYQRRVLMCGVLGAIIMRLVMILFGVWLVREIHWVLYIFGILLILMGIKMLFTKNEAKDLAQNLILRCLHKFCRITPTFHQEKFFIRQNKLFYLTPLFLVLVMIEISDVIFALDSIPAVLAITLDPFIVFTSNVFAILGLRAIYFLFIQIAKRFYLLKFGIAFMLTFIGVKMVIAPWINISAMVTLSVIISILATSIVLSHISTKKGDLC